MDKKQARRRSEKKSLWPAFGFSILLVLSLVLIWRTVVQADRELRNNLLQQTRLDAQTLNLEHIKALSGTADDLKSPAYLALGKKLSNIRSAHPKCRYVYLMGRNADGKVFFFEDAQDDSKETTPPCQPGDVYNEASPELLEIFNTKVPFVEGPLPDQWGVWISPLVPMIDPQTGAVIAVMGMDFSARDWKLNVAAKAALPVGLVLVLITGGLTALLATRRASASPKPVLRRVFPALSVLLLLLIGGFAGLLVRMHRERLIEVSLQDAREVANGLHRLLDDQSRAIATVQEALLRDEDMTLALKAGDRDRLLAVCRPLLTQLHALYGISHFYFSDTNRVCMLRVHKPEKYGDRFNRFTALEAERTGGTAPGIELGTLGSFTLRVVRPVFDSGGLIGYLEFGKEIEDVLESAGKVEGMEKILLIRKNTLDRSQWETGMRMMNRKADWDRLSDYVISYSSIPFPKEAERLIGSARNDSGDIPGEVRFDRKDWRVMTHPMRDAAGQRVGELLLLQDVTASAAAHHRLKTVAISGAGVLLTMLLGLVFVLLRRTDISLLAQQESLRESEKQHRLLLQHLSVGVVVHATDTSILFANGAATRILGLSLEQMSGKVAADPAWRFVREDGSPLSVAEYPVSRVLATGRPLQDFLVGIERSAARTWVLVNAFPQLDAAGQMQQIEVTFIDITERRRAEEFLRAKTALLEAQMNTTIDGILVVDANHRRTLTNQRIAELFNTPRHVLDDQDDTVLLKHVVSLTKYPELFLEKVMYLYDHNNETSRDEIELKNGMILDRYSAPVLGPNREYYGRIWIFRDITARKQAEEMLRENQEQIRRLARHLETVREEEHIHFADELHDELGQILSAIKIDLSVAAKCSDAGRMKEIIGETQRLLSEGILGVHSLCRELRPGALDDLGLTEALVGLVEDWKRHNDVKCDFCADIDEAALTDKIRTAAFRIVQEALGNVSRHARASEVRINLVADEQTLRFSVADDGCGMEAGWENKSTAGFGLFRIRERLEVLNGELHIQSSPGKGTCLEATIPLPRTESA